MIRAFGISGAEKNNCLPPVRRREQIGLHFHHEEVAEGISRASGASSPVSTEIQSLVINLGDNDKNVRKQAVDTLMEVAQKTPKDVVLELKDSLKDPNEDICGNASYVLAKISEVSPGVVIPAVPELTDSLKDPNEYIRSNASYVLAKISEVSPEAVIPAVPELKDSLKDPNEYVRVIVSIVLGNISKVSPEAVIPAIPELRKALKDPNEKVRVIASYLLRRIGAEIYNYTVS